MIEILMAVSAASTPVSVFGVEVGRPLSLSECAPNESYLNHVRSQSEKKPSRRLSKPYLVYEGPTAKPCFQRYKNEFSAAPLSSETITIRFPFSERIPLELISKWEIQAFVRNGSVDLITFETPSYRFQEMTLAALKAKFGNPSTLEPVPLQNGFGAQSQALRAVWHPTPTVKAVFSSFAGNDQGDFTIGTADGIAAYEAKNRMPAATLKL